MKSLESPESNHQIEKIWYYMRNNEQVGPFTYEEMIGLMQNQIVFDFDYCWAPQLAHWTRLAETQEFQKSNLKLFFEKKSSVFHKREFKRIELSIPIYTSHEGKLGKGELLTISEKGCSVISQEALLNPGDHLNLHLAFYDPEMVSFNIKGRVISKQFNEIKNLKKQSFKYVVLFSEIPKFGTEQIKQWILNPKLIKQ